MKEYVNRFLELLRYVRYIKDEKVKIQRFLSGLPQSYKDRIEFYEPRNLEETIRKAKYCYEQSRGKPDYQKMWKDKKDEKSNQSQEIHNLSENHSNVGYVEDPTCAGIAHSRMRVQGQLTTFKRQKQCVK